ncbi:hypothetical protein EI77_04004 [Prosthecobacter fusiformis]|uniref:Dolichyl-phosphate-mannose-protein mannosyltransferase n=1 Tax=Prosthecobacter fusiformis TaxID=48464 RepID=A0A4R7RNE4_9BACT|nr:hypothetical protein [Prosthecobacter fusiformis]TDU64554.1 hypothetical protein EI77_04004 [Prosthecobacter fusiformis]
MRASTYVHASRTSRVITRWRGMGAILAVAFYSLFFAAHQQLQDTPIYVRDAVIFGAETQTVFRSLTASRMDDHRSISAEHPAFILLHHAPAQLLIRGWEYLGQDNNRARKHGIALLTCLAGALIVVMVYHAMLWNCVASLRAILLAMACGAGPCLWLTAPLPEVWIFAGLGVATLAAVSARGSLAPWWLHTLVATYAMSCFVGSIIPVILFAIARCAHDSTQQQRFTPQPLLIALAAVTLTFGLANLQRIIYPLSAPLPPSLLTWKIQEAPWSANRENAGRVAREVFLSNLVAPSSVATEPDSGFGNRRRVILPEASWSRLDLQKGIGAAWFLLLALAFAGLVWRAQLDPFSLGIVAIIVWNIAVLPWYATPDRLLLFACLWTPAVVIATGLGLERSLDHWPKIKFPITILLAAFVAAQITKNWMFIQDVINQVRL